MKIEKLKKSHKKQVIIGAVAVCIVGGALTFATTRAKYKLAESIPLVRGTVNYKVPDLRTVALYTANDSGTYVETNNIPTSGYQLNKIKSVCKVYDGTTSIENAPIDSSITIEYTNGKVNFYGLTKRNTRCYLYFDKYVPPITIPDIISSLDIKTTQPDFSKTATTNEGIFKASDGMYGGTSYYWRGASTTNHLIFADKCWRIVRINGDQTMRLIYNGTVKNGNTCTGNTKNDDAVIYNSNDINQNRYSTYDGLTNNSSYVGWTYTLNSQRTLNGTDSNAKTQTEKWYNENIGNNPAFANKVADGKFCNDRNLQTGGIWNATGDITLYYAAYGRLQNTSKPTLACNVEDTYILKVGAITGDELMMAGGKSENNTSYYIYTGQSYWTMTPYYNWYGTNAAVIFVNGTGYLSEAIVSNQLGLRPVINLKSDTTFKSGGNGTLNSPYIVN